MYCPACCYRFKIKCMSDGGILPWQLCANYASPSETASFSCANKPAKNTVGWFVVTEKHCFGWKNKLKSTDYKLDEQGHVSFRTRTTTDLIIALIQIVVSLHGARRRPGSKPASPTTS
jgi:hypothetical protein